MDGPWQIDPTASFFAFLLLSIYTLEQKSSPISEFASGTTFPTLSGHHGLTFQVPSLLLLCPLSTNPDPLHHPSLHSLFSLFPQRASLSFPSQGNSYLTGSWLASSIIYFLSCLLACMYKYMTSTCVPASAFQLEANLDPKNCLIAYLTSYRSSFD